MLRAVIFSLLSISMRTSKNVRTFLLAILFFAAASLSACARKEIAQPTEGPGNSPALARPDLAGLPLNQQTEQKLDPLTKEDVDLYLKIMRAAAERVRNMPPADQAALVGATKILAASASGRVPTRDDVR